MKLNNFSYLKDYRNLKVLVTGSTGFKGTWLIFWLKKLGAKVVGIGLKPESDSVLFKELKIQNKSKQYINNIENFDKINQIIKKEKPDIIFHLAAQSIVSESYKDPLGTIRTNTLGSANILESVRLNKIKNLVFITSDKCYLNREQKLFFILITIVFLKIKIYLPLQLEQETLLVEEILNQIELFLTYLNLFN